MRFSNDSPEAQQRLLSLIDEMNGQSDRGVAIVGTAWVEEAMSAAIGMVFLSSAICLVAAE